MFSTLDLTEFSVICRTCLSKGDLLPMFPNISKQTDEKFLNSFFTVTGLKIEIDDGLPQNICRKCTDILNNTHNFRRTCKEAETMLLNIKEKINKLIIKEKNLPENTPDIINEEFIISTEQPAPVKNRIEKNEICKKYVLKNKRENKSNEICFNETELKIIIKEKNLPENTPDIINEEFIISTEQPAPVKNRIEKNEICKKYVLKNKRENKSNEICFNETELKIIVDKEVNESKLFVFDVTDSNNKKVICMLCQKRLLIKSFWSHMSRSHPGADERQVKCDLCDNYVMKEKMNRHKKLMHGNSFKCRYCKCEFKEQDSLVKHVASCPEKKKRRDYETSREMVECEVCSKTMQKGSLRVHKAIKHAGLGPVCDHCGKRFGNKLRLHEHYRAKHGYEKFKCTECEFQSASIISLKNHERRHRGEKPFVCETCGADFHAAYLLVQHRHSHRTEKRFKCDKCPASFKARNSLHTHTSACHTQTRVACSVCARAYSCRHYALKHMRAVHRYTGPVPPLHTHTAHDAVINK